MPLEIDAIAKAFGLAPVNSRWEGHVGTSDVTGVHIGMGPAQTRAALSQVLDEERPVDHVMIAGICGGLDPNVAVGTLINPAILVDHATGATYTHRPPGFEPVAGKLIMTEGVSLDPVLTRQFFEDGCIAVDMESAAVAEVCEAKGRPWSVYRCISDRPFDGLLDEGLVAATNPDGSGDMDAIRRLLAEDPTLGPKLEQLAHDTSNGARLAAEAAFRGCLTLE
jgi:adenosylhomocysteine nucleosidase